MNSLFTFYASDSFLHRRNPTMKLLSLFVMVVTLTMAFDPWTPAAFLVVGLLGLRILGRVPLKALARPLIFFFILGALGFVGSNALFYSPTPPRPLTVLWQAGPLQITAEGIRVGISLAIRMMAIVIFSLAFIITTDPTKLVLSLIQQARFPFRLGYGILVAYRFMPLWRSELETVRAAHRIRGVGERTTLAGRWEQIRRYAVPLLAGAIRKAERVAVAMESKGFGLTPARTYYRQLHVTAGDWVMLAGAIALTAGILLLMAQAGLLSGFGVVPED